MSDELILLVPEAPAAEPEIVDRGQRKASLDALRLGLLDNSKANADHLLRMLVDHVSVGMKVASVTTLRKGSVALPASETILDQLARDSDLVLSAMAD
jgi:hypothetical protein